MRQVNDGTPHAIEDGLVGLQRELFTDVGPVDLFSQVFRVEVCLGELGGAGELKMQIRAHAHLHPAVQHDVIEHVSAAAALIEQHVGVVARN